MKLSRTIAGAIAMTVLAVAAHAGEYPALNGKPVIDQADIIPADQEAKLNERLFAYEQQYGHQLAVATVKSLDGVDIESYANGFFRELGLGNKDVDDGVLLLVAPNERQLRIEVGYGLEPVLTDARASQIINEIITPKFKAGDMPGGIDAGVTGVIAVTSHDQSYITELRAKQDAAQKAHTKAVVDGFMTFLSWVFGVIVTGASGWGLVWLAMIPKRRRERLEAERRAAERQRRLEEEQVRRAEEREQQRIKAAERAKAEAAQRAAEQRRAQKAAAVQRAAALRREQEAATARAAMLAALTPAARQKLLADEAAEQRRLVEIAQQRAEEQRIRDAERAEAQRIETEARRKREAEQRQRDEAERARRRREDDDRRRRDDERRRNDDYSGSSGSSFSGGGGSSGGGGASGSW